MTPIEILMPKFRRTTVIRPTLLESNGRWGRLGQWIASWFTQPAEIEAHTTETQRVQIDRDNVLAKIRNQKHAIDAIWNEQVERIVCGYDVFETLNDIGFQSRADFMVAVTIHKHNDLKVFGVPVTVVPWFEGLLLVPKAK